jgi:NitT/TauT family transport system substrate-binding protein
MNKKTFKLSFIALLVLLLCFLTAGCGMIATPTPTTTPEPVTLRFVAMPILDMLPMYVAQEQGFFAKQGIKVEFIPANSAAERDQIMAAGQADGLVNDLLAVVLFNRDKPQIQVVRFANVSSPGAPLFRILAAPNSSLRTPADLSGVAIGISQDTIIDYVTDKLLRAEGLTPEQIRMMAVPKMNDRMALLSKGELKAATLPEPFSTLAITSGAIVILDDTSHPEYGNSVISFRKTVIDEHPQAVTAFLAAVEQAVTAINQDPERWSGLLRQYNMIPDALVDTFPVPKFPTISLPTEAQFKEVVAWALEKNLISNPVEYLQSVNTFSSKISTEKSVNTFSPKIFNGKSVNPALQPSK